MAFNHNFTTQFRMHAHFHFNSFCSHSYLSAVHLLFCKYYQRNRFILDSIIIRTTNVLIGKLKGTQIPLIQWTQSSSSTETKSSPTIRENTTWNWWVSPQKKNKTNNKILKFMASIFQKSTNKILDKRFPHPVISFSKCSFYWLWNETERSSASLQ